MVTSGRRWSPMATIGDQLWPRLPKEELRTHAKAQWPLVTIGTNGPQWEKSERTHNAAL